MDKNECFRWIKFINKYQKNDIELGKTYWVAEWSWSPMCDGIGEYEQTIRKRESYKVDGVLYHLFFTNMNYRTYLLEEISETKECCKIKSNHYNAWCYDYITERANFIKWIKEEGELIETVNFDGELNEDKQTI